MKNMRKLYFLASAGLLVAALSCTREELSVDESGDGLERVSVTLNLKIHSYEDGTPETKTIQEPEESGVTSDSQIANFLVLQFDGVTSSAFPVGGQLYFDHWPLTSEEKVTLVASDAPNTVIVLANTFGRLSITSGTTLGTFLEQDYTTISDLSGIFTRKGEDDYIRMSGSKYLATITAGSSVDITLKRNVAKIVVNVSNISTGEDAVTISKAHLEEINGKYYYLTHIAPELKAEDASLAFTDPYSSVYPRRFDNDQEDFTGPSQTYTYYVPANLRGTTSNTAQYNKGNGAPVGATKFRLFGTYGASNTPINYTYYLGGNLTNDFNIRPNYKYTYNITINSKGDANYDYRIEDMGEVKFATDANCYMLHPPEVSGQSRIYAIPVRRAAVFWNDPTDSAHPGGVYGGSTLDGYTNCVLDGSSSWTAEVLWSDFQLDPSQFLQVSSGTGFDPTNPAHTAPYFKVKVDSGMKGNVVVAMKLNNSNILWSWHLWITEYDPDKYVVSENNKYIYGVQNGEIHRYNTSVWNAGGIYASGFAMDRNLGALTVTPGSPLSFGLFYQFGRKDPFVNNSQGHQNKFYLNGIGNEVVAIGTGDSSTRRVTLSGTGTAGNKNVRYSVANPMIFIYNEDGNNWTVTSDDLGDRGGTGENKGCLWNDPKFQEHAGDQITLEPHKSIYDPCPPGWKVPIYGSYENFNADSRWGWGVQGLIYYPRNLENAETTGSIFFPAGGYRSNNQNSSYTYGGIYSSGTLGFYWTATPNTSSSANILYLGQGSVIPWYSNDRAFGCSVRCVRE